MKKIAIVNLVVPALALSGCGGGDSNENQDRGAEPAGATTTQEIPEEYLRPDGTIMIRANDPVFRAPPTVPAGPASFTVKNEGRYDHQMRMVQLDPDDPAMYELAKLDSEEKIFEIATEVGMIGRIKGGALSDETIDIDLEPGRYGLICLFIDKPTGETHASYGMTTEFTVE